MQKSAVLKLRSVLRVYYSLKQDLKKKYDFLLRLTTTQVCQQIAGILFVLEQHIVAHENCQVYDHRTLPFTNQCVHLYQKMRIKLTEKILHAIFNNNNRATWYVFLVFPMKRLDLVQAKHDMEYLKITFC